MAEIINARWTVRKSFKRPGSDFWYGAVRDDRSGRVHRVSTGTANGKHARQRVLDWVREQEEREKNLTVAGVRFDVSFEEWLSLQSCRPITLAGYRSDFNGVYSPAFGERRLDEIDVGDIERFVKALHDRGAAVRTRSKHITRLRSFFRWAKRRKYLTENAAEGVKAGRGDKAVPIALSVDDARALLRACREPVVIPVRYPDRKAASQTFSPPEHVFLAVAIGLFTGLRRRNIFGLRWKHVDLGRRRISIPAAEMKAGKPHSLPIHPALLRLLEEVLRARSPASRSPRAGTRKVDQDGFVVGAELAGVRKSLLSACRRAGVPEIMWHGLRHTFATLLAARATFGVLREVLGHSPGNVVTSVYVHPSWDEISKAVASLPNLLAPDAAVTAGGEAGGAGA